MMSFLLGTDAGSDENAGLLKQWQTFILTSVQESDEKETIDVQFAHSVPSMIRAKSMSNVALGDVPSMTRSCSAPSLSENTCPPPFSAGYDSDDISDDEDNYF